MMIKRKFLPLCMMMILVVCAVVILLVCLGQGSSAQSRNVSLGLVRSSVDNVHPSLRQNSLAQSHTVSFPVGLMGPSGDTPPELGSELEKLADVAANGFNVVYEFRSVQEIDEAEDYLLQADAVGLLVIQNMPACRAYEFDHPTCDEVDFWTEAEWATFISTLSTHDNLVAWYLPDEIDDYEAAANLYEWVQMYDPLDRPVYANPGSFAQSDIDQFPAFADFLWAAGYPDLRGEPQALTTHMMKMDANACRGTDTRWSTIVQFFDNHHFPQHGAVGHPTPHELRSNSYQAIIGGGKGLWYFNYEMGRGDGLDGLWDEMITIADEIIGSGGLDEVILAPDVPQGIERRIVSGPAQSPPTQGRFYNSIQFLQKWRQGDGTYLFAVNIAEDAVEVEFDNLWAETDAVEVLFEDRTIPIIDDAFSDTFAQDDVHIYFYAAPEPAAPLASLTIVKTDSPDPVAAGATLAYTVVYSNDGPSEAQGVILTDTLPSEVTFGGAVSVAPSLFGPTVTLPYLTWYTPRLAAGASGTIVFTVTVDAAANGSITNSVVITSSTLDDNPDNNDADEQTLVTPVNLTVIKSDNLDPVTAGATLTYAITVTNNSLSAATGVTLTDILPVGVTFGSAVPSRGICSGTGPVVCNFGTLDGSTTATLTIVVTPTVAGTMTNRVSVAGNETDFNMADNTATEDTTVYARLYLPLVLRNPD
jgi:uncharacterized repeat protein (TIGR01451 family)